MDNDRWFGAVSLVLILAVLGCGRNRTFYRQQADADAYCLIDSKSRPAQAMPGSFRIDVDPRSRMFDPNSPDCEPMPPDDPASHTIMQCVDCKPGSKCWRCLPRTPFVESPSWQSYLPRNALGEVEVDLQGSVELALLHSNDYQSELEDLYLSALDVSFERFRFDTQFFGGSDIFFTADGRDRSGSGNSSSQLDVDPGRFGANRLRARRLNATGGELVVGFANSLMWQFAGPDDYSSNTVLDFNLVQPLLRAGGRTRVLERLTISERALLANVRAMERYRRGFYLQVATGRDPGQGPSRRGGFFGGSGLEGFSGVGGGGFGNVGNFGGFFGGGQQGQGGGVTGGAGAAGAGGFLGLLQNAQQIRNQRANVAALNDSVAQLQASYEAGRIDRFQVDLARQALYNAQSQLLTADAGYIAFQEEFKIRLGLPPELPLKVNDTQLDEFNLLDPDLEALQARVRTTLDDLRALRLAQQQAADAAAGAADAADPQPETLVDPEAPRRLDLDTLLAECSAIEKSVAERIQAVAADLEAVDKAVPQRIAQLKRLATREEAVDAQIDVALFDPSLVETRVANRRRDFTALKDRIDASWRRLAEVGEDNSRDEAELTAALVDAFGDLSGRLLELSLLQAGARLEAITFEPVELSSEDALMIASFHRRDWQNARAQLVDTWRLIYFNANDLLSDLDIVFSGDIGNVGDNPFRLRNTRGRLRAGIQFDAPLTRLSERNVYRQSLIEYQQARRNYYRFRDRLYQSLRSTLRQVRLNEINFELRRAAVQVAISQVDLTQLRLSEPPQVGVEQQFGDTAARDLVQSLADLLNVQNDFLSVWVNHEVQRLNLDFDLGVMQLDPRGLRLEREVPYDAYLAAAHQALNGQNYPSDIYPGIDVALDCELGGSLPLPPPKTASPIPLQLPPGVEPAEVVPSPSPGEPPPAPLPPARVPASDVPPPVLAPPRQNS
jgi:hypothetical protein